MGQAISPSILVYRPIDAMAGPSSSGALADISFVQSDLTAAGILSVVHGLSTNPSAVAVFDETGEQVTPNGWRIISASTIEVDVSSFTPIPGTWKISITP